MMSPPHNYPGWIDIGVDLKDSLRTYILTTAIFRWWSSISVAASRINQFLRITHFIPTTIS